MASLSLLQHYFEYIKSPPVLLAILAVVGPIVLEIFNKQILSSRVAPEAIPGCFRLGLSKRSNLNDQDRQTHNEANGTSTNSLTNSPTVKALFTYPIESCRGVELAASEVGSTGLKYDRMFTFAQLVSKPEKSLDEREVAQVSSKWTHQWRALTQQECPRLQSLRTELWVPDRRSANQRRTKHRKETKRPRDSRISDQDPSAPQDPKAKPHDEIMADGKSKDGWAAEGGCLIVKFLYEPDYNFFGSRTDIIAIRVRLMPTSNRAKIRGHTYEPVATGDSATQAINITNEIPAKDLAKLKYNLGVSNPIGLFRLDNSKEQAVSCQILNLASTNTSDTELSAKDDSAIARAHVYMTGLSANAEDSWKRIALGRCIKPRHEVYRGRSPGDDTSERDRDKNFVETDGEYYVAALGAGDKSQNGHLTTGVEGENAPSTSPKTAPRADEVSPSRSRLGMQMTPLFQQGIVRVGDEIKVLEIRSYNENEEDYP